MKIKVSWFRGGYFAKIYRRQSCHKFFYIEFLINFGVTSGKNEQRQRRVKKMTFCFAQRGR